MINVGPFQNIVGVSWADGGRTYFYDWLFANATHPEGRPWFIGQSAGTFPASLAEFQVMKITGVTSGTVLDLSAWSNHAVFDAGGGNKAYSAQLYSGATQIGSMSLDNYSIVYNYARNNLDPETNWALQQIHENNITPHLSGWITNEDVIVTY